MTLFQTQTQSFLCSSLFFTYFCSAIVLCFSSFIIILHLPLLFFVVFNPSLHYRHLQHLRLSKSPLLIQCFTPPLLFPTCFFNVLSSFIWVSAAIPFPLASTTPYLFPYNALLIHLHRAPLFSHLFLCGLGRCRRQVGISHTISSLVLSFCPVPAVIINNSSPSWCLFSMSGLTFSSSLLAVLPT